MDERDETEAYDGARVSEDVLSACCSAGERGDRLAR